MRAVRALPFTELEPATMSIDHDTPHPTDPMWPIGAAVVSLGKKAKLTGSAVKVRGEDAYRMKQTETVFRDMGTLGTVAGFDPATGETIFAWETGHQTRERAQPVGGRPPTIKPADA